MAQLLNQFPKKSVRSWPNFLDVINWKNIIRFLGWNSLFSKPNHCYYFTGLFLNYEGHHGILSSHIHLRQNLEKLVNEVVPSANYLITIFLSSNSQCGWYIQFFRYTVALWAKCSFNCSYWMCNNFWKNMPNRLKVRDANTWPPHWVFSPKTSSAISNLSFGNCYGFYLRHRDYLNYSPKRW